MRRLNVREPVWCGLGSSQAEVRMNRMMALLAACSVGSCVFKFVPGRQDIERCSRCAKRAFALADLRAKRQRARRREPKRDDDLG